MAIGSRPDQVSTRADAGLTARGADPLLTVRDLDIASMFGGSRRPIVSGVSLDVARAETIGIVGESGSGKSMTAKALMGLLPPGVSARGRVEFAGLDMLQRSERELRVLRGSRIGMVFQDPFTMLNPVMRCGAQVCEAARTEQGRRLRGSARRVDAIRRLAEVGIDDPQVVDRYPFQLSGGMRQRVGIAAALAGDPELLIADEPSTALDVTTQKEILALLKSLQHSRGMGLILITHDLRVAFSLCDRIYVLYAGSVVESGAAAALEAEPFHPYTLGLLLSEPPSDRRLSRLAAIPGSVPQPGEVVDCCTFASRCSWVREPCRAAAPPLISLGRGRASACIRIHELGDELHAARAVRQESAVAVHESPKDPLVTVDSLTKVFASGSQGRRHEVFALREVTLAIAAGESVGLVGESGSGKTTLGRCLVGLETATSGSIEIDGIDASDYRRLDATSGKQVRRTVQMIFQDPYSSLNPVRTVGSTLSEAVRHADAKRDLAQTVPALLARVGLPASYAERKPVALSGGERQRVAIARALAVQPRLIVCDEPVSALDVSVQAQILNLFAALREELGIGYLFITHDLAVVRQVVDRVYVLYRGEIVEQGDVARVLDAPTHPYTEKLISSVPSSHADWLDT
jgi:peptide/nickel transport system ATP-binding protein